MNRQRYQENSRQQQKVRLPPSRQHCASNQDVVARDLQNRIGRRPSLSFPSHPIQNSTIGERIQIEQLHTLSQLTANSYGSADISYSGPPAHQNSSQSQSTFSVSPKGPQGVNIFPRLNPVPSVAQPLNPARALLHMGKYRRVKPTFPGSNSESSIVSNDSRQNGPMAQLQRDSRSTWGTQGSLQSESVTPAVDREDLMRALREELMALVETKKEELGGSFQAKQEELSSLVNTKIIEVERAKTEELRTLRLTLENVSEEVKFQIDGLEEKFDKISKNLDSEMKELHLVSSRELEEKSQALTADFQTMAVFAQEAFKKQVVEAKQELSSDGRELLQIEGQRQIEVIKSFAKSWISDLKRLAGVTTSSMVKKCLLPIDMVGSLLHGTQGNQSPESGVFVDDTCNRNIPTITPVPRRTQRKKRSSPLVKTQHHKRQRKCVSSQSSTVETSITIDTKSVMAARYSLRGTAEIAPLELRLSQKSYHTASTQRRTRSKTRLSEQVAHTEETKSTTSVAQGEHSLSPSKKHLRWEETNKENKTPASLKVRSISLVTPLAVTEKAETKHKSNSESCLRKEVCETPQVGVVGKQYRVNRQSNDSKTSAFHPKCERSKSSSIKKTKGVKSRSTVSVQRIAKGAVRIRRRSKRTYSKRLESSIAADDHLTFSFESER